MSNSAKNTKQLLSESFKELLLHHPFEKITIKMITDSAGVIRPTFYNYFQDKYEIFEFILEEELMNVLYSLLINSMEKEAIKMIFTYFDKNRSFYNKAFKIEGQNSFDDILFNEFYTLFNKFIKIHSLEINENTGVLTSENILRYYCIGITYVLKMWILQDYFQNISPEEMYNAFMFLISHSISDIFNKSKV